jgi:thiol-disulfide isomerase/thioredoxin
MKKHKSRQAAHRARPPGAASGVVELTGRNFESAMDGQPLAAVDFRAPSSAASRAFAPVFAAAAARHPDVLFAAVDIEAQQALVAHFNIGSTPTLMIFRDDIIVHVQTDLPRAEALDAALGAARSLDMEQVRRQAVDVDEIAQIASPTPGAASAADAPPPSIETFLRPPVRAALMDAGPRLSAGGLVVIRDAFEPDFAERMYRSLDGSTNWRVQEGYEAHFHYHYHALGPAGAYPADLDGCSRVFDSPATKDWVTRVSGRPCPGPTEFFANWYLPGDYLHPHNDVAANDAHSHRQVTFVWYLAKEWRPEWGGALFWCPTGSYLPPSFNTLCLFNVGPESTHSVTHVSPFARGKRLAITGWWTGPVATRGPLWTGPERIGGGDAEITVY